MIDAHYLHTFDVERPESALDQYGNSKTTYKPHLQGLSGRFTSKAMRVLDGVTGEYSIVSQLLMLCDEGHDIRPSDRIVNVRDDRGDIDRDIYRIDVVLPRRSNRTHHQSLQLERISGKRSQ